ncbi:hypothetical protein [Helicobacter trogontum]|uniref:Uncharacterized protein n=1 Tax=Helicobacter trogontum TaxID=50960 RepID=A0A4V6I343_9HELI|nr:hypothetical protein [Helicobacter trogontum]MDY5186128.1 hypothetical protein [Helicobacter trogontum]TLD98642.1 hypothetical protein LS80_004140 [Helicobacter trogontum]
MKSRSQTFRIFILKTCLKDSQEFIHNIKIQIRFYCGIKAEISFRKAIYYNAIKKIHCQKTNQA